ncbi:MAG TPA: MscL family protein [Cellvibrio sp.]|nr:MscL family protein [Cellvibrio sp.]
MQTIIDFTIIAFAIFMLVKVINKVKAKEPAAPAAPTTQEVLLAEIRDLLKQKQ